MPTQQPPSPVPVPVQRFWTNWPTGGRIAAVVVPLAVVAVVVAVVAVSGQQQGSTSGRSSNEIAGSLDDWIGAVCPSGKAMSQIMFPGSRGGGACIPDSSGTRVSTALYDQFDSTSAMQTALSAAGAGYYATATASDGSVTVFYVTSGQGVRGKAGLEPLEQFGFEVMSGPVA